jgi:hypothetical protein
MQGIYGRSMYETWYKMTQMVLSGFPLGKCSPTRSTSTISRRAST